MVLDWSLSYSKSPQISKTRLRILAVLSNAVVWIVSTRPPTSKSSRPFNNPLVIVPNAPITIGTIITFMFHSFFNSLARLRYLSLFSLSFRFILWSAGTAKWTILQILFFCCWLLWGLVFWPGLRVFHISVSRWSFTGVWVTTSLLKSPGLFSVFWPISTTQLFEWSPLVLLFPSHLVLVSIFW